MRISEIAWITSIAETSRRSTLTETCQLKLQDPFSTFLNWKPATRDKIPKFSISILVNQWNFYKTINILIARPRSRWRIWSRNWCFNQRTSHLRIWPRSPRCHGTEVRKRRAIVQKLKGNWKKTILTKMGIIRRPPLKNQQAHKKEAALLEVIMRRGSR